MSKRAFIYDWKDVPYGEQYRFPPVPPDHAQGYPGWQIIQEIARLENVRVIARLEYFPVGQAT